MKVWTFQGDNVGIDPVTPDELHELDSTEVPMVFELDEDDLRAVARAGIGGRIGAAPDDQEARLDALRRRVRLDCPPVERPPTAEELMTAIERLRYAGSPEEQERLLRELFELAQRPDLGRRGRRGVEDDSNARR